MPDENGHIYNAETLTVGTTTTQLTSSVINSLGSERQNFADCIYVKITVKGNTLKYGFKLPNGTVWLGHSQAPTDVPLILYGKNQLENFRMVMDGTVGTMSVDVSYYAAN